MNYRVASLLKIIFRVLRKLPEVNLESVLLVGDGFSDCVAFNTVDTMRVDREFLNNDS